MKYIPVIGLEVHVELSTKSKMFCQCEADYFGKKPNTNVCPVCLGMPGALPVPNMQAVEDAQLIGRSLNCKLNKQSKFDRKHYFYPDLPKGYQISQYDEPLSAQGNVEINGKKFRIQRVHLEEDTGKLLHSRDETLIDFNRSGVPLVEIVTEPDFSNSEEVKNFLEKLQKRIRYLKVSRATMEDGSMRLEPNISLKEEGSIELPKYKVEVKNINSFRFVKKAIEYELKRQQELIEKGEEPLQETRGFNENKGITFSQRTKEEAHDYRYFPEPDIPSMNFSMNQLKEIEDKLPPFDDKKVEEYILLGIRKKEAEILADDIEDTEKFDRVLEVNKKNRGRIPIQYIANWLVNQKRYFPRDKTKEKLYEEIESAYYLRAKIRNIKDVPENILQEVMKENKKVVDDYKSGKLTAIKRLIGEVMKKLKGQANATIVRIKLEEKLK